MQTKQTNQGNITLQSDLQYIVCIRSYDDSKDITSSKKLNWNTSVGNENLDSSTYRELHLGLLFNKCKQSKLIRVTLPCNQIYNIYIVCIRSFDDSKDIRSSKNLNWKTLVEN